MTRAHFNRGAALIYVMLIFVTASVIALALAGGERLDILRTARFIDVEQARQYTLGAEFYARLVLYTDMHEQGKVDYAGEAWGNTRPDFTIAGGAITMHIEDLRSRFNVSGLLTGNPVAQQRFIKLCAELGIDAKQSRDALTKLTPNSPPPENFTTDVSATNIAALAVGAALADASELIDAGLPVEMYRVLEPYITALPNATIDINVNTAPDILLRAYLPDAAQAQTIRSAVASKDYMEFSDLGALHINDPTLRTTSDFFRVHITVNLRGQLVHLTSTLFRRNGSDILTIARAWTD